MSASRHIAHAIRNHGRDILSSEGMTVQRQLPQHGSVSVYEHSLRVCELSLRLARILPGDTDERSLVRAALLHDYFLYDWHVKRKGGWRHSYQHPHIALKNAERDYELNDIERDAISCHMFPIGLRPPATREGRIICISDKVCALHETLFRREGRR